MGANLSSSGDGTWAESFGISVAFDGTPIAVGLPDEQNGKGSFYIFEKTGNAWIESVKLSPEDTGWVRHQHHIIQSILEIF